MQVNKATEDKNAQYVLKRGKDIIVCLYTLHLESQAIKT